MINFLNNIDVCNVQIIDPSTIIIELKNNLKKIIDTSNLSLQSYSFLKICKKNQNIEPKKKAPHCKTINLSRTILNKLIFAKKSAYFQKNDNIIFLLPEYRVKFLNLTKNSLFLAAEFNNWLGATKDKKFQLKYTIIDENPYFTVTLPLNILPEKFQFKFVSSDGNWIDPEIDAPNKIFTPNNSCNYFFDHLKTGDHLIALTTDEPLFPCDKFSLFIDENEHQIDISPWLFSLYTNAQLGVNIENNQTIFRIFIPRAYAVRLLIYDTPLEQPKIIMLSRERDHTWTTIVNDNLHGKLYHYQALFFGQTDWTNTPKILDPYAKATYSREGPGIILKKRTFLPLRDNFIPQHIKDDVILEVHLRDLLKNAPVKLTDEQRLTFSGLTKWLTKKHCYLRKLGINTIEFQPLQENDAYDKYEYHWGYMPVNYFSPASIYATSPKKAPMEFKKLIKQCHKVNLAVILDVVYNHVGYPNHLYNIDPDYFFRKNPDGTLQNFSGCGNDLRTESPMVQRLIIDSLTYFIKTYHVDGFRFDLAELLGQEFLYKLETELRFVKNDIQIIYEPWSFRGHIGHKLHHSTCSAWNDEYREFIANYVRGNGNIDGIKYFLNGSLNFRSAFPYQSINYIASHDDRCWIDKITENIHFNGTKPTENDKKRTHIALAIMMMSLGVPMLPAGQDILFSKHGHNNTYKFGDINALDYNLLTSNRETHKFFKRWIRFRLSHRGSVTRLMNCPSENYIRFFSSQSDSAIGMLYNADHSLDTKQIFFAINPHNYLIKIDLHDFELKKFRKLADINKFFHFSKKFNDVLINNKLSLAPLSIGLWIE